MVTDTSYGKFDLPSIEPSRLYDLLLRIRESVGEETFLDALAIVRAESVPPPHPTPPPEGAVGVYQARTKLPHNFVCKLKHVHPVVRYQDLLASGVPRCLLERIVLEWVALQEVESNAG
jgi:hypothetical protein